MSDLTAVQAFWKSYRGIEVKVFAVRLRLVVALPLPGPR